MVEQVEQAILKFIDGNVTWLLTKEFDDINMVKKFDDERYYKCICVNRIFWGGKYAGWILYEPPN